jgi:serpin B
MNKLVIAFILILLTVIGFEVFLIGGEKQPMSIPNNDQNQPSQQNHPANPIQNQTNQQSAPVIDKNMSSQQNHPANPSANNSQISAALMNNVVDANNQFAADLYLKYRFNEGNLFFSPYSISSALAMAYEGAKGRTAEEIQAVIHLPNDIAAVHSGFVGINNDLNKEGKSYSLSLANALWSQKDYPFVSEYFSAIDAYYGGKATGLDFKSDAENSRVIINSWVENKTNNRIKNLIPRGTLDATTRLILTNAIYFKANWSNQFDSVNTQDRQFKLGSGQTVISSMMSQIDYFNYGETGDKQILEVDYLGNDISMLILLPKENNLNQVENTLSIKNLNDWKTNMHNVRVDVTLPKFKFETKYFMANDLKDMGMSSAFKYPDADFTGISPTRELFISEVVHQTFVEVAEYGTEAAAATAVIMLAGSIPQTEQPKIFNADHPFIFIIQQKNSGNILFIGRLSDPTK